MIRKGQTFSLNILGGIIEDSVKGDMYSNDKKKNYPNKLNFIRKSIKEFVCLLSKNNNDIFLVLRHFRKMFCNT